MSPDSYGTKYGTFIGTGATPKDDRSHGQSSRRALPARRHHITQKVKVAGQRTLYLSVHDDEYPTEIFIRQNIDPLIKSPDEDLSQITQQEQSSAKGEDSR